MKNKFSNSWKSSAKPSKQRKYRHDAPLHVRQKLVSSILDKPLREKFGMKSISIRKGDEVVVLRGENKKKKGAVLSVDLKSLKVTVDNVKKKKRSGEEFYIPIDPSNIKITKLNTDDKKRLKNVKKVK